MYMERAAQKKEKNEGLNNQKRGKVKVYKARFEEFTLDEPVENNLSIEFVPNLKMNLIIELGKTMISARDVIALEQGSLIELDRLAGENVDIKLNEDYFAKGEVIVLDETYGVRITSINKS